MYFEVINHQIKWENFLSFFPTEQIDIYFDYKYLLSYEKNGDGKASCALFIGDNGMRLLYPFIKTEIPDYGMSQVYYDISSCYGYGGPLIDAYNTVDMSLFETHFHNWCKLNNIIGEFIRFHPLLNNFDKFKKDIVIEKNRNTVYVDLSYSLEELWANCITSKNRNQIRKAEKSGITIRESADIKTFVNVYTQTMQALQADGYYYFSDNYFRELAKLLPQNMVIFEAILEEKVIAAAMFMFMGDKMHYHLAGSIREYLKFCPNNLILSHAIKFGITKGFNQLHLGGGTSASEQDSLFKFKKSFSSMVTEFYIGKRVHNPDIYTFLIKKWEEKNKQKARMFLQYEFI